MKTPDHQWFAFVPSQQSNRKATSPTHYLPNRGMVTIKPQLATHIANCVKNGEPPTLFVAGWWDEDLQEFRAGLSIPKPKKNEELKSQRIATVLDPDAVDE